MDCRTGENAGVACSGFDAAVLHGCGADCGGGFAGAVVLAGAGAGWGVGGDEE